MSRDIEAMCHPESMGAYHVSGNIRCTVCGGPAGLEAELSPQTGAPLCRACRARELGAEADARRSAALVGYDEESAKRYAAEQAARARVVRRCARCGKDAVHVLAEDKAEAYVVDAVLGDTRTRSYAGYTLTHVCGACEARFKTDSVGLAARRGALGVTSLALGVATLALLPHAAGAIAIGAMASVVGITLTGLVGHRLRNRAKNPIVFER